MEILVVEIFKTLALGVGVLVHKGRFLGRVYIR
jgi:hypothetical protein